MQVSMSSELNVLARMLDRVSEQHRWSRDFTLEACAMRCATLSAAFPFIGPILSATRRVRIPKTNTTSGRRSRLPSDATRR